MTIPPTGKEVRDKILMLIAKIMDWEYRLENDQYNGKAERWYVTPNPSFGMATPAHLVLTGKQRKIFDHLKSLEKMRADLK